MPRRSTLSDQDAKTLIKEVKKRACLWDPEDARYNDRYHMARSWTEISEILNMPENCIRVKWKNMRDLFKKELKRCGQVEDFAGKWRYFENLSFLAKTNAASTPDDTSDKEVVTKREYVELDTGENGTNEVEVYFDDTFEDPLPDKRMKVETDDDYDVMFLKSLAPYFKQLEPMRKLVVRSKMQDMLLNEIAAQSSAQFLKKS